MKVLIIFYSRTGVTKKVSEELSKITDWEVAEIFDTKNRSGAIGYLFAGREAMKKKITEIKPIEKDLTEYDLIIVGTPIWAGTVSVPVRTFLENYKKDFKRLAFFCTMGGSGDEGVFAEMAKVSDLKPITTLSLLTKGVTQNNFVEKLKKFIAEIDK